MTKQSQILSLLWGITSVLWGGVDLLREDGSSLMLSLLNMFMVMIGGAMISQAITFGPMRMLPGLKKDPEARKEG